MKRKNFIYSIMLLTILCILFLAIGCQNEVYWGYPPFFPDNDRPERLPDEEIAEALNIPGIISELGNPPAGMTVKWETVSRTSTSSLLTTSVDTAALKAIVSFTDGYHGKGLIGTSINSIDGGSIVFIFTGTINVEKDTYTAILNEYTAEAIRLEFTQGSGRNSRTYTIDAENINGKTADDSFKLSYTENAVSTTISVKVERVPYEDEVTINGGISITVDGNRNPVVIETPWNGNADTTWYDEAKTEYTLKTAEQLAGLAKLVEDETDFTGKKIFLASDIDLNDLEWTPIGATTRNGTASSRYFRGSFDGQGHKISNLFINQTEETDNSVSGLFGVIANASISNITLENGNVTDNGDTAGGIIGATMDEAGGVSSITNCHNNATVHGAQAAAGIIARIYGEGSATISGCSNAGAISGEKKVGGIAAINNATANTIIEDCTNIGTISDGNDGNGGILGYASNNITIKNVENSGTVDGKRFTGGIVGYTSNTKEESKYYLMSIAENSGIIRGTQDTGGIIGYGTNFVINNVENSGVVTSDSSAGGIAGSMNSITMNGAINTAAVHGEKYAGGIAGNLQGKNVVRDCSAGNAQITTGEMTEGEITSGDNTYTSYFGYSGRLFGAVYNSPNREDASTVSVDDNNGDSYQGFKTVGIIGPNTAWGGLVIESGTFHGIPAIGGGVGQLEFSESAVWDSHEITAAERTFRLTRNKVTGETNIQVTTWYPGT